jgi:hypothetical protein
MLPSIIVGNVRKSLELNDQLESSPSWGYKAIGFIHIDEDKEFNDDIKDGNYALPVLGSINHLGSR